MSMYPIKNRPKSNSHGRIHPFRKKNKKHPNDSNYLFVSSLKKKNTHVVTTALALKGATGRRWAFLWCQWTTYESRDSGRWEQIERWLNPPWTNIALQNRPSRKEISSIFRGELLLVQGVEITWITHLWRFNICSESVVILREFLSIVHCLGCNI